MSWWSWIILGAVLLGAELAAIDAAFYLVFAGVAAIATGLIVLGAIVPLPPAAQWLLFATLAVASMAMLRERTYRRWRPEPPGFEDDAEGEQVQLAERVAPGESGRAEWRGSHWTVRNRGQQPIEAGSSARIIARDGTLIDVEPI
ncbi:MAG: NfeD family protein [Pseudomonadota bacterium]